MTPGQILSEIDKLKKDRQACKYKRSKELLTKEIEILEKKRKNMLPHYLR